MKVREADYEVRGLQVSDIGSLSEILDKMEFNLSDFTKEVDPGQVKDSEYVQKVGMAAIMDIVNFIIRKYHIAGPEMDLWLGSIIEVKPSDFRKMPITTPLLIFKELAKNEDLMFFFKNALA